MEDVNILVVDDEDVVQEACKRTLTSQGYCVEGAMNVDEAVEKLTKQLFDVVTVDLVMPGRCGTDLIKIIREQYPSTQIIVITGYASINTAVESIKSGAFDYLSKPFTPSELILTVKKALEEKGRMPTPYASDKALPHEMIFDNIIANSSRMMEIFKLVSKVAATDTTVLIIGESGTGKELVARSIHKNSRRKDNPFVTVDCLSLTSSLLESELFGHVKGSFTGATVNKAGFFEVANHGTLFLDEIGDLNFDLQGKLLRVIQERKYTPVGGTQARETDIRLVTATNKNLKKMVETGTFREDLFYRLYVFPIFLPPLRERKEDIPLMSDHFLNKYNELNRCPRCSISEEAMQCVLAYSWPGNVRELENTIERALISADGPEIRLDDLPNGISSLHSEIAKPENIEDLKRLKKQLRDKAVEDLEKEFVINALTAHAWNVGRAASAVGMQRTNFYKLVNKYNIKLCGGDEADAGDTSP
ncbi:MAG: sigma-54-dependent Fis family transcriptional regulator [Syntrophobacterales bacterium]|nr:MAG: sigma-54-dependent Fis family transcriptional regulator [Syntrophobacterales bacterium]